MYTEVPGLPKTRKSSYQLKNGRRYRNADRGKRKIYIFQTVTSQRYVFFPFRQNLVKRRSLKKYRTNVIRVPAGDPVHFYSLELSRLA